MNLEMRNCEFCGQEFMPYKKTQKFCSRACSEAGRKSRTKRCITCGKEFECENAISKYCSDECGAIYRRIARGLVEKINDKAVYLIRYGQNNPFTKPVALWKQYQEVMKDEFNDECMEEDGDR